MRTFTQLCTASLMEITVIFKITKNKEEEVKEIIRKEYFHKNIDSLTIQIKVAYI